MRSLPPSFSASRLLALSAALGLVAACSGNNLPPPTSKDQAATQLGRGPAGEDLCQANAWYGDGECDDFCVRPDPDCEPSCPDVCAAICAGEPEPAVPDSCPIPSCVCDDECEPGSCGEAPDAPRCAGGGEPVCARQDDGTCGWLIPRCVEPPTSCGGKAGTPCPAGYTCEDDPADSCDPETGGADCPGICVESSCGATCAIACPAGFVLDADGCPTCECLEACSPEPPKTGRCSEDCTLRGGYQVVDGAAICFCCDDCSEKECGPAPGAPSQTCEDGTTAGPVCGRSAAGACGWTVTSCPEPQRCGGIADDPCPDDLTCVDDPSDDCDPANGGADCTGFCMAPPV